MKKNKNKKVFIKDDFIDIDFLIPTEEEIVQLLKNIDENRELSFENMIVLKKLKLIKMIKNCKGAKI